jgi:hypothetical protein
MCPSLPLKHPTFIRTFLIRVFRYSAWLLLAFIARVIVYGALALGYTVGSNKDCPVTPESACDPCQNSFYVLTNIIESEPFM